MSSKKENANPLQRLEALGQSLWLDYIRRDRIDSGGRWHRNERAKRRACAPARMHR